MFPRLLRVPPLIRTAMLTTMMIQIVCSKPQDTSEFENVASQALTMAGNMVEIAANAGIISKNVGFELPFASANSETQIATGTALRNNDDDSSEEDRRKRSLDMQTFENSLIGEENLLALPPMHEHIHRSKRSPCHHGGGGGTAGGGTNTDGDGIDDADLDVTERRRRAQARKRKEAARRRAAARKRAANLRNKKLVNDDNNELQVVARRKRQTELDDLNQNQSSGSHELTQHAQQIADKMYEIWDGFVSTVNDFGQKIKKHFGDQDASDAMDI